VDPATTFGWTGFDAAGLAGRDPEHNAAVVQAVLAGELGGVARAAVTLNAGAAVYVAGLEASLEKGVERAEAALGQGKGVEALDRLRDATRRATA